MPSQAKPDPTLENIKDLGRRIDWSKTAGDYAQYRAGFPDAFFERLAGMGIIRAGHAALDLGCGTGTIARGLAIRGMQVTGLDRLQAMMERAARLDREAGVMVRYVTATAESTGLGDQSFDLVTAGQCWPWFDSRRTASEVRRVLKPGGRLVIANFDWIPLPGNVADETEKLIMTHNPAWKLNGGMGIHPLYVRVLGLSGYRNIETFSFDLDAPYTHESWRGRIRASAGIGADLELGAVERFDAEMAAMLDEKFPGDSLPVHHRVFAAIGVAP
ncbi:MAG TPA: class I SAM-dependent methyltransferase [Candidatus Binataceae bacterium]|nr:class I SAM-dependent methyltransferase [Candidatus Binataceae bacterium]